MKITRIYYDLVCINGGVLPVFCGFVVRGWFLDQVRCFDEGLAERIHGGVGFKPYAVVPLFPLEGERHVEDGFWVLDRGTKVRFGVSIFEERLGDVFLEGVLCGDGRIRFVKSDFQICGVDVERKGFVDFARDCWSREVPPRIVLRFRTPTQFRIKGRKFPYVFPDAIRVFGNLSSVWNSFAPKDLHVDVDDFVDWVSRNVYVRAYELKSRSVYSKKGVPVVGFLGWVEYRVLDRNHMYAKWLYILTNFAEYSNVGWGRTAGFGAVTYHIPEEKETSNKSQQHTKTKT